MKLDLSDKGFLEFLISMAEEDVIEYYWHWIELDGYKYIIKFDDEYEDYCHEEDNLNDSNGWYVNKFSKIRSNGSEVYFEDDEFNLNSEDIKRFEKIRLNYKLQNKLTSKDTTTKTTKI